MEETKFGMEMKIFYVRNYGAGGIEKELKRTYERNWEIEGKIFPEIFPVLTGVTWTQKLIKISMKIDEFFLNLCQWQREDTFRKNFLNKLSVHKLWLLVREKREKGGSISCFFPPTLAPVLKSKSSAQIFNKY